MFLHNKGNHKAKEKTEWEKIFTNEATDNHQNIQSIHTAQY